jgi:hypothetical protein
VRFRLGTPYDDCHIICKLGASCIAPRTSREYDGYHQIC